MDGKSKNVKKSFGKRLTKEEAYNILEKIRDELWEVYTGIEKRDGDVVDEINDTVNTNNKQIRTITIERNTSDDYNLRSMGVYLNKCQKCSEYFNSGNTPYKNIKMCGNFSGNCASCGW